jgi:acetolactate synthase-1/2/3 large subunit
LAHELNQDTIVTCDVGQHQMWVAQAYPFRSGRHHLSSSGLGAMGYGLPAAIGAQFAHPGTRVLCVTGDGSLMMNIQELATVKRYSLPIKILLFDNQALGLVRQWQKLFYQGRLSEVDLSDNPDFVAVAHSFGIPAIRLDSACQEEMAVQLLRNRRGPLLIHVPVDPQAAVWPLVPPGSPNHHMLEGAPS